MARCIIDSQLQVRNIETNPYASHRPLRALHSLYEAMNLIIVTLPLIGFKDEFAMQLDDVMDSKRCPYVPPSYPIALFCVNKRSLGGWWYVAGTLLRYVDSLI